MSDSETTSPPIPPMEEAYRFFNAVLNPDGSLTRLSEEPTVPATPDPDKSPGLITLSRDITLNPSNDTFIRLYRPRNPPPNTTLPLIIYIYGGGFVFGSAAVSGFHEACNIMAAHIPAVIASVNYRREPEHRLPAAYDDATDAVSWAKTQALSGDDADPWVKELADFSKVFLMGTSAGGNVVYHMGLRALALDLQPIKIVGLIMNQPFFGGIQRTGSELKYYNNSIIPLYATDLLWSLALPEGADRGHEYCDPTAGGGPDEEKIRRLPAMLVRAHTGDILFDKDEEFAKMLEARGGHVTTKFIDGGYHGVDYYDPQAAQTSYDDFKDYVLYVSN